MARTAAASTSPPPSKPNGAPKGRASMGPEIGQGLPIQHGDVVCVREEGMPIYDPSRKKGSAAVVKKGDLYVQFKVEMPSAEWLATIDAKVRLSLLVDSFLCFGLVLVPFRLALGHAVMLSSPLPAFQKILRAYHVVVIITDISHEPTCRHVIDATQTAPSAAARPRLGASIKIDGCVGARSRSGASRTHPSRLIVGRTIALLVALLLEYRRRHFLGERSPGYPSPSSSPSWGLGCPPEPPGQVSGIRLPRSFSASDARSKWGS